MQKKWRKKGCVFFIDFLGGSFPNEKQHIALTLSGHMTVSRWDWLIVVLENNTITDAQESLKGLVTKWIWNRDRDQLTDVFSTNVNTAENSDHDNYRIPIVTSHKDQGGVADAWDAYQWYS